MLKVKIHPLIRNSLFVILSLALIWASLFTGSKSIDFSDLINGAAYREIFLISRIPRTLALILVGMGLSVAGFVMQQISQNKFVSPTTAGALDAAKMGILFGMILIPQVALMGKMFFAMFFTFLASLVFMLMVQRIKFRDTVFIPLIGIMFGHILGAIATFFAYKHNIVQNTQEWLLGDFSSVMEGQYEAIYLILPAVVLLYFYADHFTIVGMGSSFAKNLGLSYNTIVNLGLFSVSLVVSASMVTVGAIPFLGLVVPNVVSLFLGDNLKRTLPYCAFAGAVFLLVCDLIGRLIIFPFEVPIGMMVGVIGGASFLFLIGMQKR